MICRTNDMIERSIGYSYMYNSDCESSVIYHIDHFQSTEM